MPADNRPSNHSRPGGPAKKKTRSKRSGSNPLLLWGGVGAGVFVVIGLIAFVVSRGARTGEVVAAPAAATTLAVAAPVGPTKPKPTAFSERAAAEWVVSVGGRVRVLEPGRPSFDVYDSTSLPKGDFRIEAISLDGLDAATDDQIAQLWGLQALHELGLSRTKITDVGLEHLPQLSSLSSLNLRGCPISDAGLATLGQVPNLTLLVADGGLPPIASEPATTDAAPPVKPSPLPLVRPFTDTGIKSLSTLKELQTLALVSDQVGDPGLASIAASSLKLTQLRAVGFQVTDTGVLPLIQLTNLRVLELSKSKLTDKCIDTLSQLKWLTHLIVQGTQITPDGVKRLQQQLPNCQVFGGKYDPRRNSIRDILVLGGKVTLTPEGQPQQVLVRFEDLPEKFTVQSIDLHEVRQLWLDDLSIPEVTDLILTDSGVSPASIRRLPQLFPNLIELDLAGTAISDREATALADCQKLTHADLTRTGVTDLGGKDLEQKLPTADIFWGILRPSPDVEAAKWIIEVGGHVYVQEKGTPHRYVDQAANLPQGPFRLRAIQAGLNTHINDQEIQPLAGLRYVQWIEMQGHSLTDAGVPVFETMPKLSSLNLTFPAKPGLTDNAMPSLRKIPKLRGLSLAATAISIEGLTRYGRNEDLTYFGLGMTGTVTDEAVKIVVEQFPNLTGLAMGWGQIGDPGFEQIAKLTKLQQLTVSSAGDDTGSNAKLSDVGLASITTLKELTLLDVSGRGITDKGLEPLKQLPNLKSLTLSRTSVSDAGIKHLIEMKSLTGVNLLGTQVTIRGFKQLSEARPDIGISEPSRSFWLRGMFRTGAKVTVATKSKKGIAVPTLDDLPKADFLIQIVDYTDHKGDLSLPFPHQKDADAIEIRLANTNFNGYGLFGIAHCKGLQVLDLTNTNVVDEHLKFLHGVKTLQRVNLTGTHCTAPGIAALKAALPKCKVIGP